jgi:glycosyltransferase involved in cell wall biosynthesis
MPGDDSLSVIIPALNEEAGLAEAVDTVLAVVPRAFSRYEVLIFDDGSTDRTGEIADDLATRHPHVRAYHHRHPLGLGGVIRRGWELASMRYAIWVDGQGVTTAEALHEIFAARQRGDLVVPYASNQGERSLGRRVIARVFRAAMNALFALDLRQYTHLVLCETALARSLKLRSRSHALQAEAVVKMIKSGSSYVQVAVEDRFTIQGRKSKAFRLSNITGVATAVLWTFWDVAVTGRFRDERIAALDVTTSRRGEPAHRAAVGSPSKRAALER